MLLFLSQQLRFGHCDQLYTLKFSQQTKRTRGKRKLCVCDGKRGSVRFPSPCLSESVTSPTRPDAFSHPIQETKNMASRWNPDWHHNFISAAPHMHAITPGLHVHARLSLKSTCAACKHPNEEVLQSKGKQADEQFLSCCHSPNRANIL